MPAELPLRLDFARHCFNNAQKLTRLMDQKASLLLTAVGILTAALGTLIAQALGAAFTVPGKWEASLAAGILVVVYLLLAFAVVFISTWVFIARPNTLRPDTLAPGLLFPLILLKKFDADEDRCLERLSNLTPPEILFDYANQIIEIANIYRAKQRLVNLSIRLFQVASVLWLLTMLLLLAIIALA